MSIVPVVLLMVSLACLGSWLVFFKLAGKNQRFELFAIDFALGTLFFSFLAAFTLGNTLSDLPFGDQLQLASKTSQALVASAGLVFGFAGLLLLGAISLLGITGALPVCIATGLIFSALLNYRSYHLPLLLLGVLVLTLCVLAEAWAFRLRYSAAVPGKKVTLSTAQAQRVRSLKGLIMSLVSGLGVSVVYLLAVGGMVGELGVGPYGGMLFFSAGMLFSILVLSIFSFNIALEGPRLGLRSYFEETRRQHLYGIAGGAIWAMGALTAVLANSSLAGTAWGLGILSFLPVASALLAMIWGTSFYKEFVLAPSQSKTFLAATAALLVCGFWLLYLGRT